MPIYGRSVTPIHSVLSVQALSIPMGSKFEVSADIRHMWGIVPQVKGMEEGLDGHRIHLGLVAW